MKLNLLPGLFNMGIKNFIKDFSFKKNIYSAKFWAISVISLIILLIFYFMLLDRYTPHTGDAYIQAFVIQIAPQVEGRVTSVEVSNNQFVEEGEVLFQIDPRPFAYAVDQLKAELAGARQDVDQLKSDIIAMDAELQSSKANLKLAKQRYNDLKPLVEKNFIAKLEFDKAIDELKTNEASVVNAEVNLLKARQALEYTIDGEYALIKNVQAQLSTAEYNLEHSTVYAPTKGIVTNLQLTQGAYIKVGDPVLTFVDLDSWWIVANFKENSLSRIKPGQEAEISIAMYPGKIFHASVESIGWGVSSGQGIPSGDLPNVENPVNWFKLVQRFPVRLKITDIDGQYPLRVGGSVSVTVFNDGGWVLDSLAKLWLRIGSYVDYLY